MNTREFLKKFANNELHSSSGVGELMRKSYIITIALFILIITPPEYSYASGCNYIIKKKISFPRGSVCWSFEGRANTFVGDFAEGQRITVRMQGRSESIDNPLPQSKRSWEDIMPSAMGPNKFIVVDADSIGKLNFIAPYSGNYSIDVGPCAFWTSQIKLEICAR